MEIKVIVKREDEDDVTGILYSLGAGGLSIEDPQDVIDLQNKKESWELIDINLIDENTDEVVINAYFPDNEEYDDIIARARERIEEAPLGDEREPLGLIKTKEIDERDWSECWKKYYKPVEIGERIVIKPTWEEYVLREDQVMVEIDPGMAFGTGTHETTYMCSEILEEYLERQDRVFDIGVGSGILSIVAAKLGAREVVGVDIDPLCIKISNENVDLNKVGDIVRVEKGDLLDVIEGEADLIVSNILAEIIVEMVPSVEEHLKRGGILITSGIIEDKAMLVEECLVENDFEILDIRRKGEWVAIISKRR